MAGPWRPSTARRRDAEHQAMVDAELARLSTPADASPDTVVTDAPDSAEAPV